MLCTLYIRTFCCTNTANYKRGAWAIREVTIHYNWQHNLIIGMPGTISSSSCFLRMKPEKGRLVKVELATIKEIRDSSTSFMALASLGQHWVVVSFRSTSLVSQGQHWMHSGLIPFHFWLLHLYWVHSGPIPFHSYLFRAPAWATALHELLLSRQFSLNNLLLVRVSMSALYQS